VSTSPEEVFVATVARHFPGAYVAGNSVDAGFVELGCRIGVVEPFGGMQRAQLLFDVTSSSLGGTVQLSMNSYGPTLTQAIVDGACGWTCSFGPVLRAAFSGDRNVDDVPGFGIAQRGRTFHVYVDAFDHILYGSPAGGEQPAEARARFAVLPWFAFHVLGSGAITLDPVRPQLLAMFVGETPARRVVEAKLDGVVQLGFDHLVVAAPPPALPQIAALRELAIVVPD
jgi:hypothetical protein